MSEEMNRVPACLFQLPRLPDYVLRFRDDQTQMHDQYLQHLLGGKHWSEFTQDLEGLTYLGVQLHDALPLLADLTVGLLLPALGVLIREIEEAEQQSRQLSTECHLGSIPQELIFRFANPAAEAGTTVISEVARLYSQEQIHELVEWFPFDYLSQQVDISDILEDFRRIEFDVEPAT